MHQVLDFPGGPVVRDSIHAFTAGAPDSVHGWETRIPQAVQWGQDKQQKTSIMEYTLGVHYSCRSQEFNDK